MNPAASRSPNTGTSTLRRASCLCRGRLRNINVVFGELMHAAGITLVTVTVIACAGPLADQFILVCRDLSFFKGWTSSSNMGWQIHSKNPQNKFGGEKAPPQAPPQAPPKLHPSSTKQKQKNTRKIMKKSRFFHFCQLSSCGLYIFTR